MMMLGKIIIIALIIALTLTLIIEKKKERENRKYEPKQNLYEFFPYQKKYLLTRNEYHFYTKLVPIAKKYNLQILTKIRLADLVETKSNLSHADSSTYFNKIKSKHIDFALVEHMAIVMLIELDDSSHNYQSRIERDIFVDDVLKRCGYVIIHTYGDINQIDYEASIYRNYAWETQ